MSKEVNNAKNEYENFPLPLIIDTAVVTFKQANTSESNMKNFNSIPRRKKRPVKPEVIWNLCLELV